MKEYCIQVSYEMSEQIDLEAENEQEARDKAMAQLMFNPNDCDNYNLDIRER